MPRWLVPQKSGVHRAACTIALLFQFFKLIILGFALYRALLRNARKLSASQTLLIPSRNVHNKLCNAFRQNARLQSPKDMVEALQQGYFVRIPIFISKLLTESTDHLKGAECDTRGYQRKQGSLEARPRPVR